MSSGRVHASSIDEPSRTLRSSGSARPAWRMNHTGVCAPRSPRAARRNGLSARLLMGDTSSRTAAGGDQDDAEQCEYDAGVLHLAHPFVMDRTGEQDGDRGIERGEYGS